MAATRRRVLLPLLLFGLVCFQNTNEVATEVLADAFWQVASYVALTLAIFYWVSSKLGEGSRLTRSLERSTRIQVFFSACMGALPGCGGAIIVITQFVRGRLSFGSVVAVLSATMGDAAFLLLSARPRDGVFVLAISFVVGLAYGLLVDALHGGDFLRPKKPKTQSVSLAKSENAAINVQGVFWQVVLIPTTMVAILGSMQFDVEQVFGLPGGTMNWLGTVLVIVSLFLWAFSATRSEGDASLASCSPNTMNGIFNRVASETNFVTCWVVASFLLFELMVLWTQFDLTTLFGDFAPLAIVVAIGLGLLPGCGPQIMVTTLYISGAIPLSAQLGNAISNDGDALFPAIALAPKVATLATIYTTVPAFFVAFGFHYL